MVIKKEERTTRMVEGLRDGQGTVAMTDLGILEHLPHGKMFCEITLEKGCSIGEHGHRGEAEVYYPVKGRATVRDNTGEYEITVGDTHICPSGCWHTVINEQDEPFVMLAVITTVD